MSAPHDELPPDLYARLGLTPDASHAEINHSFRRLARALHPDTSPGQAGDTERFQDIREAHAILSDPDRRRAYDRTSQRNGTSQTHAACPICRGRRVVNRPCRVCAANGYVLTNSTWLRQQITCPACRGQGHLHGWCGACGGTGRTMNTTIR
jgi:DnaJ-class molecular chaperone